jgi:hypothetical protein
MSKDYTSILKDFTWSDTLINGPSTAIEYVDNIYQHHREMWDTIKAMEDHIDGKRPIPQEELKKAGRLWANNWNYGKARSKLEKTTAENVDTVLNSISMMNLEFKKPKDKELEDPDFAWLSNDEIKDSVSIVLEGGLIEAIDTEKRIIAFLNSVEYNTNTWGWCAIVNDPNRDWLGCPQHIRSIGFPKKTKPDEVTSFCIFDTIEADYIWRKWHDIKGDNLSVSYYGDGQPYHKHSSDWVLEGLEEAIYFNFNGECLSGDKNNNVLHRFEEILPDFVARTSWTVNNTSSVHIATIYNVEKEGKQLTKTVIAYGNGWKGEVVNGTVKRTLSGHGQNAGDERSPSHFLFQQTINVDGINEVLDLVFESGFTTNGYIHEMRGLARACVEDSLRFNRKKNSIENKALFSGAPFLKKNSIGTGDAGPKLLPSQGFVILGDGYDLVEKQPNFDLSSQLISINADEEHYLRETQHFDPSLSGRVSSRPVTAEIDAMSAEVKRIEGSKISIKLKCYSEVLTGIIKNLAFKLEYESAVKYEHGVQKSFDRLIDMMLEGLSLYNITTKQQLLKVLKMVDYVRLEPVNTDATAIGEQLSMATTPYRRLKLNRMLALARGFSRRDINTLHPLQPKTDSLDKTKMAAVENILFRTSEEVVFSPNDDHLGDLDIHLPKVYALMEMIQAGGIDPAEGYNWLARIMQHSGMHLDALLKTPYILDQIKEKYLKTYKDLMVAQVGIKTMVEEYAKQLAKQQEQQAAAQQQGQQMDPKDQAKIEMEWAKLQNKEEIAALRSQFRADEKAKDNELRRKQKEEDHQDKLRRTNEMQEMKKQIELMKASVSLIS